MKILFLTTNLLQKSNSAAIRNISLISGLLELGHNVDVITISVDKDRRSDLKIKSEINLIEIDLGLDTFKEINQKFSKVKRSNFLFKFLFSIVSIFKDAYFFPDHYKEFIRQAAKVDYGDFDLLISSSDMKSGHYAALKIFKNDNNKKWIQIWGDPWYRDINLKFYLKNIIKYKERKLLSYASKIIYVSSLTCEQSKLDYPENSAKMFYVPRSYSKAIESKKSFVYDKISILYAGIIGPNRDLESFLIWNNLNNGFFNLNIFGQLTLEEIDRYSTFKNVNIGEAIEYNEVLDKFLEVDVLLLLSNKGDTTQIPGKFFDYIGTNLPIICLVENKFSEFSLFISSFESVYLISYEDLVRDNVDISEVSNFISKKYKPNALFSPLEVASQILNRV